MDWDKIRIFHSVAEAGSFTKAGDVLNLSQSAVSRQISSLEEELGVPLFHRHARGLLLTEQGELLARAAQDVVNRVETVQAMLTDSRQKPTGDLRVTTTVGLGSAWLTPRLKDFIELYPDIRIHLLLNDDQLDIAMRQADCAVWLRQPSQGDLIQRKLFTVHFHVYASPDYLRRYGHPTKIEDLDKHRIVTFGTPAPNYLEDINWLETAGRPDGSPREPVMRINNIHGLRRAAEQGIGIVVLPDYIIREQSALLQLFRDEKMPEFDTFFVYPEELRDSKRLVVFRDFLVGKARTWQF